MFGRYAACAEKVKITVSSAGVTVYFLLFIFSSYIYKYCILNDSSRCMCTYEIGQLLFFLIRRSHLIGIRIRVRICKKYARQDVCHLSAKFSDEVKKLF